MIFAETFQDFASRYWKDGLEILILSVCIYYAYLGLKGTRGLRVLTGLAVLVLGLALLSQLFGLAVISWLRERRPIVSKVAIRTASGVI